MASQIGRKRAATRPLAITCAERPMVTPSVAPSVSPVGLTDHSIQSGRTVRS